MHFHIVTLFPEAIAPYFDCSIIGRARAQKKITVDYYNPRDFTNDKHRRVDRRPYGGGPGMVLEAPAFLRAIDKARGRKKNVATIFLSARGRQFSNKDARAYAQKYKHIILLCGRYEGVDARVKEASNAEELSIGPFVLSGGELPAAVIVDAIARQIAGVLGTTTSIEEERIAGKNVYTRPETIQYKKKKYSVPPILLSGHHKNIDNFRTD